MSEEQEKSEKRTSRIMAWFDAHPRVENAIRVVFSVLGTVVPIVLTVAALGYGNYLIGRASGNPAMTALIYIATAAFFLLGVIYGHNNGYKKARLLMREMNERPSSGIGTIPPEIGMAVMQIARTQMGGGREEREPVEYSPEGGFDQPLKDIQRMLELMRLGEAKWRHETDEDGDYALEGDEQTPGPEPGTLYCRHFVFGIRQHIIKDGEQEEA